MPGVSQRTGAEAVMPQVSPFLEKALESLAGAESEFANVDLSEFGATFKLRTEENI